MQMKKEYQKRSFYMGLLITLIIAMTAAILAQLPYLAIVGQLVLAIVLGIIWSHTVNVQPQYLSGIEFSSKKLLRIGIILLGMRLNLGDIYEAGIFPFLYASILLSMTLAVVYALARLFKVDKTLSILTACGTAICGAAAIVAIAPLVKAKENVTAVSVAVIAVLGTLFTILYTLLFPMLPLTTYQFGIFSGGTLHEIAHAIAASSAGGAESEDIAIVVKLTRVVLLVPVAVLIGLYVSKTENKTQEKKSFSIKKLPIPWFIFGFLAMSAVNTSGILPEAIVNGSVTVSYLLLGMAMAGLGLKVELSVFKKLGFNIFYAAFLGTVVLMVIGFALIYFLRIN
ncbi:YeiH family protein [Cytobacillus purgationiresistens]|uniref:Integral membrane protein (TIGR00698 family) n=1 Tax=Cytobacillus purgationiresistens TaxID=863449 RepID=A0ABU0AGN6_9BACI|nr:YeiH family protein [Cytobacillus purgationiresistens]MDQ0270407.1 putative integral membrane protein (TIGR00698 family) [Cytobacillus purgationiresistens]